MVEKSPEQQPAGEASTQAEEMDPVTLVQTSYEKLKKTAKAGKMRLY